MALPPVTWTRMFRVLGLATAVRAMKVTAWSGPVVVYRALYPSLVSPRTDIPTLGQKMATVLTPGPEVQPVPVHSYGSDSQNSVPTFLPTGTDGWSMAPPE